MREIGIATTGMSTDRNDPRNRKMTIMTIRSVSLSVFKTSLIAPVDVERRVVGNARRHPRGQLRADLLTSSRTRRMTSRELAVGRTQIPMKVAVWPLNRTSWS